MRIRSTAPWILAAALAFAAVAARATAPELLNYQGVLLLTDGRVAPPGSYVLSFRLWDVATGGTAQNLHFTQASVTVQVKDGLYNVLLSGPGQLAAAFDGGPRFMEVTIEQVPPGAGISVPLTLTPRQQIASVPYALSARTADSVPASGASPPGGGACYTRWGASTCATGFAPVVVGRAGGVEAQRLGALSPNGPAQCISAGAAVIATTDPLAVSGLARMMRGHADGISVDEVSTECATCCSGGCYVAWGTLDCDASAGYVKVYGGHPGGLEAWQSATGALPGGSLCVDAAASAAHTWTPPGEAVYTRLLRSRAVSPSKATGNGFEVVTGVCSVCCKP